MIRNKLKIIPWNRNLLKAYASSKEKVEYELFADENSIKPNIPD